MAKKDKFQEMRQKRGDSTLSSFQDLATTVAAIEKQAGQSMQSSQSPPVAINANTHSDSIKQSPTKPTNSQKLVIEQQRFMRLPNPQIPVNEYNKVSAYCNSFSNMTRQDFVELAIIEKLHNDGQMPYEEYQSRYEEISTRPPRGQRKGMKNKS